MAFPVTLNGRTYTLADFSGLNYVDGFPAALEDFVTHAGDIYNDTSTSSIAIGTGSKTFTVSANKPYQAGTPLRIADAAAPSTNFLDCIVTSYSGTSLVVNAFGFAGSGTKASWTINIGGAKTVDGTLGIAQGGTGATTANGALTNLGITASTTELNYLDVTTLGTSEASKVVTADANGVVTFDNGKIEESTTITSSSNAATINLRDGDNFVHDLTENVTYTFSNPAASGKVSAFTLKVIQDSSARTITWPSSVDWASATAPTLTTTNNGVDVFVFFTHDGGTTYYGFTAGQAMG